MHFVYLLWPFTTKYNIMIVTLQKRKLAKYCVLSPPNT